MSGRKSNTSETIIQRIRTSLEVLGLRHSMETLDDHVQWAAKEKPGTLELLDRVLGAEAAQKVESRIDRRIRSSGVPEQKTLEAFEWNFQPKLEKSAVMNLADFEFVRRKEDLIITGKSGTGKSHILKSLALRACQHQIHVRYARCVDLLDDLYAGLADGTYPMRLKRWATPQLLLIDDVGLGQVRKRDDEPTAAHALFNLIDRRHGQVSTAFTSNIKLSEWGRYLGDATLAVAILDRVAMNGIRLDINGPSYRQKIARDRAASRGGTPLEDDHADA